MIWCFICSPYGDDPDVNERRAISYCQRAVERGFIPIAPHLYFPRFLNDDDKKEREIGINAGLDLLTLCSFVLVFPPITKGMQEELDFAKRFGISVFDGRDYLNIRENENEEM